MRAHAGTRSAPTRQLAVWPRGPIYLRLGPTKGPGDNLGEYDPESRVITVHPSVATDPATFVETLLHELLHAAEDELDIAIVPRRIAGRTLPHEPHALLGLTAILVASAFAGGKVCRNP